MAVELFRQAFRVAGQAPTAIMRRKLKSNIIELCTQFKVAENPKPMPELLAECESRSAAGSKHGAEGRQHLASQAQHTCKRWRSF